MSTSSREYQKLFGLTPHNFEELNPDAPNCYISLRMNNDERTKRIEDLDAEEEQIEAQRSQNRRDVREYNLRMVRINRKQAEWDREELQCRGDRDDTEKAITDQNARLEKIQEERKMLIYLMKFPDAFKYARPKENRDFFKRLKRLTPAERTYQKLQKLLQEYEEGGGFFSEGYARVQRDLNAIRDEPSFAQRFVQRLIFWEPNEHIDLVRGRWTFRPHTISLTHRFRSPRKIVARMLLYSGRLSIQEFEAAFEEESDDVDGLFKIGKSATDLEEEEAEEPPKKKTRREKPRRLIPPLF